MVLDHPTPSFRHGLLALQWTARVWSVLSVGVIMLFLIGEFGSPSWRDLPLMALFPGGVVVGLVLAWFKELAGGIVTAACVLTLYAVFFIQKGHPSGGPWFLILAAPAFLFIAHALAMRRLGARG